MAEAVYVSAQLRPCLRIFRTDRVYSIVYVEGLLCGLRKGLAIEKDCEMQ